MLNRRAHRRFIGLALALSLATVLNGCERFKSADNLYRDAEARYQKGEHKAVIIQLKSALQKDPQHGPSRLLSSKAYNDLGDFVGAEKEARKALELGMNADESGLELARALLGQGKYQAALDAAKLSPSLSGETLAKVFVVRGGAQLALRQIPEAKESYAKAVQAAPNYYGGHLGNARLAVVNNDPIEASRQIELALQKAPRSLEGLMIKGDLLAAQSKNEAAIAAYQEAITSNPNRAAPHLRLANVYLTQNKPEDVRKAVQAGLKVEPGNLEGLFLLARNDFDQKKFGDARTNIQLILRNAPDHMPSLLLAGAISSALGEYEIAEKHLNRVINAVPDNVYARTLLAATYLQKGQADLALQTLAPALQIEKPDERVLALAGQAYITKGDVARATELFEQARVSNPQSAMIRTQLGAARLAGGDSTRAIADLEAASAMDVKLINADMALILNYLKLKDFDKALAAIAVMEKKQPGSPVATNLRGGIHLAKGDTKAARASFEQALRIRGDFFPAAQNLVQLDLREKNIPAARKRYESVLAKDNKNLGALVGLAQLALLEKNDKDYSDWLVKAVAAKPELLEPRALLVDFFLKQQRPQDALRLATEAQTTNPGSPRALELLARVQFAVGDKESGLLSYKRLAQQEPQSAPVHYSLGFAEATLKQTEGARTSLRKALQLQPSFYEAAATLIALELGQNRAPEAMAVARDFQRQNPKLATGLVLEADILTQQRKYDEALQVLNKAQSVESQDVVAIRIHQVQLAAQRPAEADSALQAWLKAHPKSLRTHLYLGENYLARKQNRAAIEQYELVRKFSPDNVVALNNLATLYQLEKDARALPTAELAHKLVPDLATVADTLGWILVEQGQTARGLEILRKAAAGAPKNGEIGYHYAVALVRSGDKVAARKQLELILSFEPSFPQKEQAKELLKQL